MNNIKSLELRTTISQLREALCDISTTIKDDPEKATQLIYDTLNKTSNVAEKYKCYSNTNIIEDLSTQNLIDLISNKNPESDHIEFQFEDCDVIFHSDGKYLFATKNNCDFFTEKSIEDNFMTFKNKGKLYNLLDALENFGMPLDFADQDKQFKKTILELFS